MRTTVTLDPDVEVLVKRAMKDRGLSFKQAINEAIRVGMTASRPGTMPTFPSFDMGEPMVDVTKAIRLAGELEDDELTRRLAQGR